MQFFGTEIFARVVINSTGAFNEASSFGGVDSSVFSVFFFFFFISCAIFFRFFEELEELEVLDDELAELDFVSESEELSEELDLESSSAFFSFSFDFCKCEELEQVARSLVCVRNAFCRARFSDVVVGAV